MLQQNELALQFTVNNYQVKGDTSKFDTILRILKKAKLQVLSERLIELGIILLFLSNLIEQLYTLFH
jgi:hypothetical protein